MSERAFSDTEYAARLSSIRRVMGERGIDVLLLFAPESMNYLTGYDSYGYFAYQCLILPIEGELTLQSRRPDVRIAEVTSTLTDVRGRVDAQMHRPVLDTREILDERGLLGKRIAYERSRYTLGPDVYDDIRDVFRDQALMDGTDIVFQQRLIKSEAEQAYMRRAGRLADMAIESATRIVRNGVTEFEIAAEMERTLRANGSEYTGLPVICSRDDHAAGRGMPTADRVQPGDLVHIELAGCVRRYHAVLMRSIASDELSPGLREAVKMLKDSSLAVIAAVRPGIPIGDLERVRRRIADKAGYSGKWFARLGYGVGIAYPPNWLMGLGIQDDNEMILRPGMTFTVQPVLNIIEHGYSYLIGDTVLVTESGCEVLTNCSWEPRACG